MASQRANPNLAALLPDDVLNFARGMSRPCRGWMGISMPSNDEIAASINAVFTDLPLDWRFMEPDPAGDYAANSHGEYFGYRLAIYDFHLHGAGHV